MFHLGGSGTVQGAFGPPHRPRKIFSSPSPRPRGPWGGGGKGGGAMAFRTGFGSSNPQLITGQSNREKQPPSPSLTTAIGLANIRDLLNARQRSM